MWYRRNILLVLLFTGIIGLNAQDISFVLKAPETANKGEQIRLIYTLNNGKGENFKFPDKVDGFDVLYGPSVSQSSNVSVVKGQVVNEKSTTYVYVLLANVSGTFTLPAASVLVDGKHYKSNSVDIEILGRKDKNLQAKNNKAASDTVVIDPEDVFIRVILPKGIKKVGEPFEVTYRFYTIKDVREFKDVVFPDFKGFKEEIIKLLEMKPQREIYKGRAYYAMDVKKSILYPQQSGSLEIPSMEMDVVFLVRMGEKKESPFGLHEVLSPVEKKLQSESFVIDILP